MQRKEPRLFDLDPRVRDPLSDDTLLGERLAEGDTTLHALYHHLQRPLGQANTPHAVVDASRPQPTLGDGESLPLAPDDVVHGYPRVREDDLGVPVRRVVEAE